MASIKQLSSRIKSVQATSKLTKAMQAVAAMRLRKYTEKVAHTKIYSQSLKSILTELTSVLKADQAALSKLQGDSSGKTLVIIISPSKGFCGGLHRLVITETYKYLQTKSLNPLDSRQVNFITVNKPAQRLVTKLGGELIAYFNGPFKEMTAYNLLPISELIYQIWLQDNLKNVILAYAKSSSSLKANITFETILPINLEAGEKENTKDVEAVTEIEISADKIIEEFLPQWLEMCIHLALSETQTAEEGARMIAMNQATDNAKELMEKLKLIYFRERQAKITQEISEIIGGSF